MIEEMVPDHPLGSSETAVLAFVNLMANALQIKEAQLAYWLDCYHQLRSRFERENDLAPDDTILHVSDIEPVLRRLWGETLKKSCKEEAVKRLEQKTDQKAAPIDLGDFKPVSPSPSPAGAAAAFKRQTRERLENARQQGLTVAELSRLSGGTVSENQILTVLDCGRLPIEDYRALAQALDNWAPPEKTNN